MDVKENWWSCLAEFSKWVSFTGKTKWTKDTTFDYL